MNIKRQNIQLIYDVGDNIETYNGYIIDKYTKTFEDGEKKEMYLFYDQEENDDINKNVKHLEIDLITGIDFLDSKKSPVI